MVADRGKPNDWERNLPSVSLPTRNRKEMRHELPREPAGASAASTQSSGTLLRACCCDVCVPVSASFALSIAGVSIYVVHL